MTAILVLSSSFIEKTYIGLFRRDTAFGFEGCVQMRVLAGTPEVEGHWFGPSKAYTSLFSPLTNGRVTITCLSPTVNRPELQCHRDSFKRKSKFVVSRPKSKKQLINGAQLNLNEADISQLNELLSQNGWEFSHLAAVVLLREDKSTLVDALYGHFYSNRLVFPECRNMILNNFRIMDGIAKSFIVPEIYRRLVVDIMTTSAPILLVCGRKNTGKSTLCRFVVNSMLNRYDRVMFLECDVGQAEFTVPGVVSLHCIAKPIYGPPYTHMRQAERAYVFGDTSPKQSPGFYLQLIKQCVEHYHSNFNGIPLIVNTCGFTSGVGIPIISDIIRTTTPTHIIQLYANVHETEIDKDLPPLTADYLESINGLSVQSDQEPQQSITRNIELFTNFSSLHVTNKKLTRPVSPDPAGSSDEENEEADIDDDPSPQKRFKSDKHIDIVSEGEWVKDSRVNICVVKVTKKHPVFVRAKHLRLLSYVSYFSPLIIQTSDVERKSNFIMAAVPYEIPWSTVAIHCIHRNVPSSQLLYAINGKFVALGRVSNDEITSARNSEDVKFLKSSFPLVEYIGLGLVRGIDPLKKVFYITTPEEDHCVLRDVNCIVLGNTENIIDIVSQCHCNTYVPYLKHQSS